ncbi:MAG: hypothetical protein RIC16_08995 [Rhodospirillales bacterium]
MFERVANELARRPSIVLVLVLLAFVLVVPNTAKYGFEPDSLVYLTAADNLLTHGVMNHQLESAYDGNPVPPGPQFVPGYPALIAVIAAVDAPLRETVRCVAVRGSGCGIEVLAPLILAQKILWCAALIAAFLAARATLSHDWAAVAVVVLIILSGVPADAARRVITESLCFTAFFGFLAAAILACQRRRLLLWVIAGILLGATILVRPGYQAIVFPCAALVLVWCVLARDNIGRSSVMTAAFLVGCAAVVLPWVARNAYYFDSIAVTSGYGAVILQERLAYNAMTWPEWGAAFVYWLPIVGDEAAAHLFGADVIERLRFDSPTGFYVDKTLAFTGLPSRPEEHSLARYLLIEGLLGNLWKHMAVTLPLIVRGSKVGWLLYPLAFVCLWPAFRYGWLRGRVKPFLVVALPPLMMLVVHAAVTVNVPRYNLSLVLLYAIIVAAALPWAAGPILRRFR